MSLLLRTVPTSRALAGDGALVLVTILVISTTATPPPGYVKQPDHDKNPPKYQYNYEIEDHAGDGQGKTEKRDGEHASGRYYVHSKRSSTDVKYIADEWGYHPLVKYGSSDDHSSASASFAIGEKAVKDLQNENDPSSSISLSNSGDRKKLIQIVQPYHRIQSNGGENTVYNLNNNETSGFEHSLSSSSDFNISLQSQSNSQSNSLNVNYLASTPQQQLIEVASSSGNNVFLESGHQSSTIQQQADLVSSLDNDLTSTISEEGQLIVENAGRFGQRLQVHQSHGTSAYATSATTTVDPISTTREISTLPSSTRDGRYFQGRARQKNAKTYLPDTIPGLGAYSSTALPPVDNSVTANSIESDDVTVETGKSSDISKNSELKSYSAHDSSINRNILATTPNPLLINYASHGVLPSILKNMDVKNYEKKEYAFLKPIVVAEVPKERPFQYSTTFHCEDDDVPLTPDPLTSFKDIVEDTLSSHILNPIQAGVSLVNAGETHLIGNSDNVNEAPPAPVTEVVEEVVQSDQAIAQISSNNISLQGNNYVEVNPAFGNQQDATQSQPQSEQSQQSQKDQAIEIQKSIEIYQSSPGQAPQYLEQPAVVNIDQQTQTYTVQQQQTQIYGNQQQQSKTDEGQQQQTQIYTNQQQQSQVYADQQQSTQSDENPSPQKFTVESNSKQLGATRTRGDTLTNVYEINDNYPRDSAGEQLVYVIPPATYILEDNSFLKNSLLQEKVQQNQADMSISDSKIHIQSGLNEQPYRSYDSGISYESDVTHEQQQSIISQPGIKLETTSDKVVPQVYPVEKIIEKKVPYHVEKIIEKKVPILQPYPVPIQVPVPEPYPVHIEKVVERKIPIPVHIPIPHPYPVEKPIHIPIPIEKIVEKPVHIPITVEKIIEKKVPVPQPYPVEMEKIIERKIPYPLEVTKYVEKPISVNTPYGTQYGISYQQIMKPQKNGLFLSQTNSLAPLYALSAANNLYSTDNNNVNKYMSEINVNNVNHSQAFQGYVYDKPAIPFIEGKENVENNQFFNSKTPANKLGYSSYLSPNHPLSNTLLHRRHVAVQRSSKPERDDYFGPVPPLPHVQRQYGFLSKSFASYPAMTDRIQGSRKARNQEPMRYQKGNFRQSKIEYGFKPPMVPSVQYDEETASKVES